jgi:hypothetical protein
VADVGFFLGGASSAACKAARGRSFSGFYFLFFTVYFFIRKVPRRIFTPSIISPAADGGFRTGRPGFARGRSRFRRADSFASVT